MRELTPHESLSAEGKGAIQNPHGLPMGTVAGCIMGTENGQLRESYVYDPALNHPKVKSWYIKAPDGHGGWRWKEISPGRYVKVDYPFDARYSKRG